MPPRGGLLHKEYLKLTNLATFELRYCSEGACEAGQWQMSFQRERSSTRWRGMNCETWSGRKGVYFHTSSNWRRFLQDCSKLTESSRHFLKLAEFLAGLFQADGIFSISPRADGVFQFLSAERDLAGSFGVASTPQDLHIHPRHALLIENWPTKQCWYERNGTRTGMENRNELLR